MSPRVSRRFRAWWGVVAALAVAVGPLTALRAADSSDNLGAVRDVPADVAFYGALLRNREQVEAVGNSKAWAKLMALPAVKTGLQSLKDQSNAPAYQQYVQFFNDPDNKKLGELLTDMVSDEVYVVGGANWSDFINLVNQVSSAAQAAAQPDATIPQGPTNPAARAALNTLAKNLPLIKAPDLAFGFKLRDTAKADEQLKRLDAMLSILNLGVAQRYKKVKTNAGEFMTYTLDGSMVPWGMLQLNQYEQQPGQYAEVLKKLESVKLTISLGVHGKYLMVALGDSTDFLAKFGGSQTLADVPEVKPLVQAANQRITSVGYVSKAYASHFGGSGNLDSYARQIAAAVALQNPKPGLKDRVEKDLLSVANDLKPYFSQSGPSLAYGFLTDRGSENFVYSYTKDAFADGSKPLTLLNHVGGNPLFFWVGRSKYSSEEWPKVVRWITRAYAYVDDFVIPTLPNDDRKQYQGFMTEARPLFAQLNDIVEKQLLPSLADGQSGIVIDGRLKAKQWFDNIPPADKPLPMFEPAVLFGVSDATQLVKACGEARTTGNQILTALKKPAKSGVPKDLEIPAPEMQRLERGTGYFYRFPASAKVNPQITLNAGLTEKVAVLSLSQRHTERLLKPTPLSWSGPLADVKRPLSSASSLNWVGVCDFFEAWANEAVRQSSLKAPPDAQAMIKENVKAFATVMEVLKSLKSINTVVYVEGDATVTHTETHIVDE